MERKSRRVEVRRNKDQRLRTKEQRGRNIEWWWGHQVRGPQPKGEEGLGLDGVGDGGDEVNDKNAAVLVL